ncbi:hypothetical protein ACLOJK_021181 [Asimina triloba]
MTPVIPCSIGNISLFPASTFISKKDNRLTKCKTFAKYSREKFHPQRLLFLPQPISAGLFHKHRSTGGVHNSSRIQILYATGTDVAVEESNNVVEGDDANTTSDAVVTNETSSVENTGPKPVQSKRTRPSRKSEMPPVKNEELIPGTSFTGKVRSILPFGAFVDFGAFTDGLVHVSRISDSFVKDVGSLLSVGQEVTVRLVEADFETGRISLTMRENDDNNRQQQKKGSPTGFSSDKPRSARRSNDRPNREDMASLASEFVEGQLLVGTVKNLTSAGAFIALPEGEEGFLPTSEDPEGFLELEGSSLQVGQEVNVRVLRITRGQVTLTTKEEDSIDDQPFEILDEVVHVATNPFELAFCKNAAIAAFLDDRKEAQKPAGTLSVPLTSVQIEVDQTERKSDAKEKMETDAERLAEDEIPSTVVNVAADEVSIADRVTAENLAVTETPEQAEAKVDEADTESDATVIDEVETETKQPVEDEKPPVSADLVSDEASLSDETETTATQLVDEEKPSTIVNTAIDEAPATDVAKADGSKTGSPGQLADLITSSDAGVIEDVVITEANDGTAESESMVVVENEIASAEAAAAVDEASTVDEVEEASEEMDSPAETGKQISLPGSTVPDEVVVSQVDDALAKDKVETEAQPLVDNEVNSMPKEEEIPESIPNENGSTTINGQPASPSLEETTPKGVDFQNGYRMPHEFTGLEGLIISLIKKDVSCLAFQLKEAPTWKNLGASSIDVRAMGSNILCADFVPFCNFRDYVGYLCTISFSCNLLPLTDSITWTHVYNVAASISPALVKQLREETGAGMMDCKKALSETGGDIVKAQEFLRKKGLSSADKKASRATAEGRIGSYVHDNRIGVLVEVNCETDFVSRGDIFKELVDDLAMQVAACPQVQYLVTEDVPEEIVNKEREIEMQKEDLLNKPEQIRGKIVDGRIQKRLAELALLEQAYIKNDKVVVKDWVKQTIATIGENIKVKRFVRYNLGEGLEKKNQDFAAEVAAQTAPAPSKDQSGGDAAEAIQKPQTVAVSAALVKQLREETGAGMMDCKKALSETGSNIEKAQEYLRKKGLLTADKKSSRLAAEGRIASYIHDSRIGVLIEVNCETDFVGRSEKFKELVDDLAMQVVACPQVQFVSVDDVPGSMASTERELEMQREDLQSKPENIRARIVDGRVAKRLGELALLEQPFIKDDSILVKDLVKQTVAALGENIKVRRFVRFTLGEATD